MVIYRLRNEIKKLKMPKEAREKAEYAYPRELDIRVESNATIRVGYYQGYHQAEKDLALTCEDVAYIVDTFYIVEGSVKEKCEEVLRRFNEYKKLV